MKLLKDRLEAKEQDDDLVKLKDMVVKQVKESRSKMSKKYPCWDKNHSVYIGDAELDRRDLEAQEHKEPVKMVIPMTFAQVQTYVSFCFLLFKQNRHFFEFSSTGPEDYSVGYAAEKILERDLRRNNWDQILFQNLLDSARFGFGVVKSWWAVETQMAPTTIAPSSNAVEGFSFQSAAATSTQSFIKYEGNRLTNISPYHFFPDCSFPLSDWKKGHFCADETEYHITHLRKLERDGIYYGVEHIEPVQHNFMEKRGGFTRQPGMEDFVRRKGKCKDDQIVCVTTCQQEIIPKNYKLGEEEYPVKYIIAVANDNRIVSCVPAGYLHDEYIYDVAIYSPDCHQKVGESLADVIYSMQDVVSYLINSRLASVRKSLQNNLIVDPSAVNMESVESRSPVITMKKGSPRLGVDRFIRQLNYIDNTASHFGDADMIMKIMQMVTGVNENSMGQFHGGRRSATEARAANNGAAARMKTNATLKWSSCYASLGRKMLINQRQGISMETFAKILGAGKEGLYQEFHPQNPADLVGVEDHFVFDSTLQSEKGFVAQSLQELVSAVLSNPVVMQVLPIDVGKLMEEILHLRGVENVERFKQQPQPQPNDPTQLQPPQQFGPQGPPQAPVPAT